MIALVGAMFVAMGSASAAALGACSSADGTTNYLKLGDTCTLASQDADDGDEISASASGIVTLSGGGAYGDPDADTPGDPNVFTADGNTITVTANAIGKVTLTNAEQTDVTTDDTTIVIEVVPAASVAITFGDSDNTVKAGTDVTVTVTGKAIDAGNGTPLTLVLSVPSTGLFFVEDNPGAQPTPNDPSDDRTSQRAVVMLDMLGTTADTATAMLSTTGAPAGAYVVTATYGARGNLARAGASTATLTVGDAGTGLASATLALGADETTTAAAGGSDEVSLVVEAFNSLGEKANPGDVNQVTIIAPGGDISIDDTGQSPAQSNVDNSAQILETMPETGDDKDDAGQKVEFTVSKAAPGTVIVYALLIGDDGTARTEDLTLTFSGTADSISLGEPSDQLEQNDDSITIEVTAADSSGNAAAVSSASITASIADSDGATPGNLSISDAQKFNDKNQDGDQDDGEDDIATAVIVTVSATDVANAKADRGTYTVKVRLDNDVSTEQTIDFVVVGGSSAVSVSADPVGGANFGDVITVTASVTDEDGNQVADGTFVDFSATANTGLSAIGSSHGGDEAGDGVKTKDGEASVKFAVTGAGTSVVSAAAEDTGVSGVVVIESTAGMTEPEAMPEEEAGLSCISSLSGFSTWTCDVEASASEIFDWISSRGATALHLNSNRMWVRYSVVDGAMVPGSSDFMVTKSDILYISN